MTRIATIAADLTDIQREALRRAKMFSGSISLTDWNEHHPDLEALSEKIADPVCGTLTPLGLRVKAYLENHA